MIAVALEGTLSDDSYRRDLKDSSFEDYYNEINSDTPNRALINFLSKINCDLVIYSTTPENLRPAAMKWLIENGIEAELIILKKKNDYRPEYEIKLDMIESLDKRPLVVIENALKVADLLREKGHLVFQL